MTSPTPAADGGADEARTVTVELERAIVTQTRRCEQLDNPVVDKAWLRQEREILDALTRLRAQDAAIAAASDSLPSAPNRGWASEYSYRLEVVPAADYDVLREAATLRIAFLEAAMEVFANGHRMVARFALKHAEQRHSTNPTHESGEILAHIRSTLARKENDNAIEWMADMREKLASVTGERDAAVEAVRASRAYNEHAWTCNFGYMCRKCSELKDRMVELRCKILDADESTSPPPCPK